MGKKRVTRTTRRTPEQIAHDEKLRAKYQKQRPSLASLQKSGNYTRPVLQGEYLAMMDFAARIKARRELLNLSLSDLASRSGIDKAAISRLENGQAENPTYSTLERIARALSQKLRLVLEDDPAGAR